MAAATTFPATHRTLPNRRTPRREKSPTPTLFPDALDHQGSGLGAPPPLAAEPERVGIARLAFSSPLADARRGTEYFLLPARSILNRCDSKRMPFTWTVNPYRGCEFGCRYCYARYTHEYMDLDGGDFERKIYVKQNAGPLTNIDLNIKKIDDEHIAIGTATDPYQPAESEFGATRAILEQLAARRGLSVSITTKSNQVVRDMELLRRIAEHSAISVNLTITTLRARLARVLEPRAPRPDLRLEAVRQLRRAGIPSGVFAMPVLPGITDSEDDLEALAEAARDAGAQWFAASVLFLMPSAMKQFLPFLDEKFPRLSRQYRQWFLRTGHAPEGYRNEISARVQALRKKYGLAARPVEPERPVGTVQQLSLVLDGAEAAPKNNGRFRG